MSRNRETEAEFSVFSYFIFLDGEWKIYARHRYLKSWFRWSFFLDTEKKRFWLIIIIVFLIKPRKITVWLGVNHWLLWSRYFHCYILSVKRWKFLIRTGNILLRWLISFKDLEKELTHLLLERYNFEMKYRAGRIYGNADALSRRSCIRKKSYYKNSYCNKMEISEKIKRTLLKE